MLYRRNQKVAFYMTDPTDAAFEVLCTGTIRRANNVDFTYRVAFSEESQAVMNWKQVSLNYCDLIPIRKSKNLPKRKAKEETLNV